MAEPGDDERLNGRLVAVAALGLVLFVPPVLAQFDRGGRIFDVPVIWFYIYLVWAVVIALIAVVCGRSR